MDTRCSKTLTFLRNAKTVFAVTRGHFRIYFSLIMQECIETTLKQYLIQDVADVCLSYLDWSCICRGCGLAIPSLLTHCLFHQDWTEQSLVRFVMCDNFTISAFDKMITFNDPRDKELFVFLRDNIGTPKSKPHYGVHGFNGIRWEIHLNIDKQH